MARRLGTSLRLSVPFVLCFETDKSWPEPIPFCYVEGFNKNGYIHWGLDAATMKGQQPASGSLEAARDYFLAVNDLKTLGYVFENE